MRVRCHRHAFQVLQQRRPAVPGRVRGALDHVVAEQRGHRDGRHGVVAVTQGPGVRGEFGGDAGEHRLVESDHVDLVDGQHQLGHAQQRQHGGVPPGLLDDPLARVHQQHRQLGGRGAGDRVPGVLHVTGSVGEHEGAFGRGEVPVGHIDGDALLALRAQAVHQQRQVRGRQTAVRAGPPHGVELVGQHRLGVVQQPPDQSALAVVDGPGGGQPQQVGVHRQGHLGAAVRRGAGGRLGHFGNPFLVVRLRKCGAGAQTQAVGALTGRTAVAPVLIFCL